MKKTIAILILVFAVHGAAHAQLGGMLKKAKETVKKETEKVIDSKSKTAETLPAQSVGNEKESEKTLPKNTGPSAEAKLNDPQIGNTTVETGFTKSVGDIHVGYEQLNNYYHKPYWVWKEFYILDDETKSNQLKLEEFTHGIFNRRLDAFETLPPILIGVKLPENGETRYVPLGEHVVHAYFALFDADPTSSKAYDYYAAAKAIHKEHLEGMFETGDRNSEKTIIDGKTALLLESEVKRLSKWNTEQIRLDEVMHKQTPFGALTTALANRINTIAAMEKSGNYPACRNNYRVAKIMMEDYENHPGKKQDDNYLKVINAFNTFDGKPAMWQEKPHRSVSMPATFNLMSASEMAPLLEATKTRFEKRFKVDKVVFLSKAWENTNTTNNANEVTGRKALIGIITKDGTDTVIRQYILSQPGSGKAWEDRFFFYPAPDGNSVPARLK